MSRADFICTGRFTLHHFKGIRSLFINSIDSILIFQAKYTHGDLDRDFSTVVIFNDQVYRHEWDPSLVEGFDEKEQFYPTFMLFTNRTDQPHQIDQSFFVVEQSDVNKRIRIGQGSAEGSSLSNTIKFSISQGQSILDVKTVHGEIWIQVRRAN